MKLSIDIDGVLADFDRPFCTLLEDVTGRPCPYEDPDVWEWPAKRGFTNEEEGKAWNTIRTHPNWWMGLPTYPDSLLNFNELRGVDVYFVTARSTPYAKMVTERWLKANYTIDYPTVITSKDKGLVCKALHIDAHIDDKPEHLVDIKMHAPFTRCYLRNRKHNEPARPYLAKLGVVLTDSFQTFIDSELQRLRPALLVTR